MTRPMISGMIGSSGGGAAAASLPAASTRNGISNLSGGYMTAASAQLVPSGDWSFGVTFSSTSVNGSLITCGSGTTNYLKIGFFNYGSANIDHGTVFVDGYDSAGRTIGGAKGTGVQSHHTIPANTDIFLHVQKNGNWIEIWIGYNGNNPVLSGRQYTDFTGFNASRTITFTGFTGYRRDMYFISSAFTASQIGQIMRNEAYPHDLATPASTDFYLPFSSTSSPFLELTSGKTTFVGGSMVQVSGIGYAYGQTEAVYVNAPKYSNVVYQHDNGTAAVALSGTYSGTHGATIQAQVIDKDNASLTGWRTVASTVSGGVWSGVIDVPKKLSWLRVQVRKVIDGVVSTDVMTACCPWGVGVNAMYIGQSLAQHKQQTNPNGLGASGVQANGYVAHLQRQGFGSTGWIDGQEVLTVSSVSNSSGSIKVTTSAKHARNTGDAVAIRGVVGTTEANGFWSSITVTSPTEFILDGSSFVNAYVSGGSVDTNDSIFSPETGTTESAAMTRMGNALSIAANCVVALSNRAIDGSAIEHFYSASYRQTAAMLLEARRMGVVGVILWHQGHGNTGDGAAYFSTGGTYGAYTGYGKLGTLLTYLRTNIRSTLNFGLVPFNAVAGTSSITTLFRMGMHDWVKRMRSSGDTRVFSLGFMHDYHPVIENGIGVHLSPTVLGYIGEGNRIGNACGKFYANNNAWNGSDGPEIVSATRSGASVVMTVQHKNGSSLKVPVTGAMATGFEFSTSSTFASLLTVSNVQITGAAEITATLASDPGAPVYIRYMPNGPGAASQTPIITGVADNGAGLIRVTCGATTGQISGGLSFVADQWVRIQGVGPSALGAIVDGFWQVIPVSSTAFDLKGSSSTGLPTFTTSGDVWRGTGTSKPSVVNAYTTMPIYDNTNVAGVDSTGLPLQPTYLDIVTVN